MSWWARLLRRNRVETQLDRELHDHIERQVADHVAAGLSDREARRRAYVEFGGLDQVKELCRDVRGTRWLEDFVHDVRYGSRVLRRNPSFTAAAVLSMALGIGASTAIFTLVDATMLKPLPVHEPDRLVELMNNTGGSTPGNAFSYQALVHLQEHTRTVDIIASHDSDFFVVADGSPPELAKGQYVTGTYFPVLGVSAAYGRTIEPSDDQSSAAPIVVLSHGYWQRRFAADRSVIGRTMKIDDRTFTVAGVASSSFSGLVAGRDVDLWVPLSAEPLLRPISRMVDAGNNWLQIVARVRTAKRVEEARAELSALYYPAIIEPKLAMARDAEARARLKRWSAVVTSARTGLAAPRQQYGEPLTVLFAISGLVLLIACVNVANLLLARASSRRHEMAVRLSLGASSGRVLRQLLTESVLLSFVGAALGVGLAYAACEYLVEFFATTRTPIALDVGPDVRVLTFAALLALMTGVLFGLAPAWRAIALATPVTSLQNRVAGRRNRQALTHALVGVQVALSVIMLFCGGLFLRSLHNIRSVDKGFDSSGVLIANIDATRARLDADRLRALYRDIVDRLTTLPGVKAASVSLLTPIWGGGNEGTIVIIGGNPLQQKGEVSVNRVSPAYFATTGTPIQTGRDFSWQDIADGPKVAIVNQTLSRRYFGSESAIGQRLTLRGDTLEIVGIVGDAKYYGLRGATPATLYVHWMQQHDEMLEENVRLSQIAVRTETPPLALAPTARDVIRGSTPLMAITNVRTFEQQVDSSIARDRAEHCLRIFCLTWVAARRDRALRIDGLHGRETDQRDRNPDGIGRRETSNRRHDRSRGDRGDVGRSRHRHLRGAAAVARPRNAALRVDPGGFNNCGDRRSGHDRDGHRGRVLSKPSSRAHQPYAGAARRVRRTANTVARNQ
jgi:predicted permease